MGIGSEHVDQTVWSPPGNVWSSTSLPANDAELVRQFQAEYQEVVSNTAAWTMPWLLSAIHQAHQVGPVNN